MYSRSIFIFRRDLRLNDNTGLIKALSASKTVAPVFIFDPVSLNNNPYRGDNCVQFMLDCLTDLNDSLLAQGSRLFVYQGNPSEVVESLAQKDKIEAVFVNHDFTPYSISRDAAMRDTCNKLALKFHAFNDLTLQKPENWRKDNGQPYSVYTPFFKKMKQSPVAKPTANTFKNYATELNSAKSLAEASSGILETRNARLFKDGGRRNALSILTKIDNFKNHKEVRDFPGIDGTTGLSAHNKFGSVSIREVYHAALDALGPDSSIIAELYWREFFTMIGAFFPHVFSGCFHKRFDSLEWYDDPTKFQAWCEGRTGFPIVDAGMRQLNETGFMHNRVRMIVASFLMKDLHINWRMGERYFAQKLIDYDPAVNNGNWQWAASTGCDAQPWFRIFNPWLQQQKFDPSAAYIKKWVPELATSNAKAIHNHLTQSIKGYIPPIINHAEEREVTEELYGDVARAAR